jgi:N-acetylglucosamine-6-phosphate deacetylase
LTASGRAAVLAAEVFDGDRLLRDRAVVLDRDTGRIADLCASADLPAGLPVQRLPPDSLLAPGFIDVQVNGGGGVLFNDRPEVATLRTIAAAHRRFGTTGFLPTLITAAPERMAQALAAARAAIAGGVPGVLGVHFEGPWLAPARRGAHPAGWLRAPGAAELALLTTPGAGRTVVTLAPERVDAAVIRRLVAAGVRVCLGHSDADHATARSAVAAGASGFTHLFNAMSPLAARAPGMVGAALDTAGVWCGIIADGVHVHPATLRLAIAAGGAGRFLLVTDAMSTVGSDITEFVLQGAPVRLRDGRLQMADGTLAGAALDMAGAVRNAVRLLGMAPEEALRMASLHPARFLGMATRRGRLAPGYAADLTALTADFSVPATWIGGRRQDGAG